MKNGMMSSLLIAAAVLFSCEKEEAKTNVESSNDVTEITENKQKTSEEDSSSKNNQTWYVHEDDLIDELMAMQKFNEDANFSNKLLVVKKADHKENEYAFTLVDKDEDIIEPEVVCEGGGYDFATCVRDWLEEHEGCLTISGEDGEYVADDDCEN